MHHKTCGPKMFQNVDVNGKMHHQTVGPKMFQNIDFNGKIHHKTGGQLYQCLLISKKSSLYLL